MLNNNELIINETIKLTEKLGIIKPDWFITGEIKGII